MTTLQRHNPKIQNQFLPLNKQLETKADKRRWIQRWKAITETKQESLVGNPLGGKMPSNFSSSVGVKKYPETLVRLASYPYPTVKNCSLHLWYQLMFPIAWHHCRVDQTSNIILGPFKPAIESHMCAQWVVLLKVFNWTWIMKWNFTEFLA